MKFRTGDDVIVKFSHVTEGNVLFTVHRVETLLQTSEVTASYHDDKGHRNIDARHPDADIE